MKMMILGTLLVNAIMIMLYKWSIHYEEAATVYIDEAEAK